MSLGVRVEDPLQTISHLLTAYSNVHTLEISMSHVLGQKEKVCFPGILCDLMLTF